MFNLFKKKESKSYSVYGSIMERLNCIFNPVQSHSKYLNYYFENSPVFTATKLISDACAGIDIVVQDEKTGKFNYDHESLNLIRRPNPFKDKNLIMKELVSFSILTGNSYIDITNSSQNKPLEWDTVSPKKVSIEADLRDGYPSLYQVTSDSKTLSYYRDKSNFITRDNDHELCHLRDFNPLYSSSNLLGSSAFAGCQLEISQYLLASIHNNALLENEARPSGLLTYKGIDPLGDDQVNDVKEILNDEFSGARNAGKTTFLNGQFDWIQLSQNVKDMDFPTLKKSTAEACYTALKIPIPMVSPDNMSFANMDASKYAFHDNAVLPVFKQVLSFLTKNILKKYKGSENLIFTFDEASIESLATRKMDNAIKAGQTGVLSTDEIRSIMGYEALTSGGDVIYQPMNLIPIGSDAYTQNNRDKPAEKAIFIKTLQDRGYSKEKINKCLEDYNDNLKSS